ncbi:hypothetical protein ACJJTC_007867 [Scirpophaga incertulas]
MEQLDEKPYVISFPNATRIHTLCGNERLYNDLRELHNAQSKIITQHPLHLERIHGEYIYQTTIPLYTILLLSILIGGSIFLVRRHKILKLTQDETKDENGTAEDNRPRPAIFSQLRFQK